MNTKILFLDLDGTLLNDEKEISRGNAEAIRQALQKGHKIVINTGRASSSALKLAEKLQLNMEGCYAITFNGACIYDLYRKEAVHRVSIPREYVRYLLDTAKECGIHAHTYDAEEVISEQDNADLQKYLKNTDMTARIVPDACACLEEDPCKVLLVDYACRGRFQMFQEKIRDWASGKVDCFFSCKELLEAVAPGVSKGNAIRTLCAHLQIPLENSISAGDAQNDISMLKTTAVSVVMKNAEPSMYVYGDYITEQDNNHDGIAEVIRRFMIL